MIRARRLFFMLLLFVWAGFVWAAPGEVSAIVDAVANLAVSSDSDSEDEDNYTYSGLAPLSFSEKITDSCACVAFSRGFHYSPTKFNKKQRSRLRHASGVGEAIFSAAARDVADTHAKRSKKDALVEGQRLRKLIKGFSEDKRNQFQQTYTNTYDSFHKRLAAGEGIYKDFESAKNPQVSTSEDFLHSAKYAAGLKFLGKDVSFLRPDYDATGRPKHPYLGKVFFVLIPKKRIATLAPYFVAWGLANKHINVSTHFSNNILSEREVSFPGYIPGRFVAFSMNVRVPNFTHAWQQWHKDKYGMSKRSFSTRKTKVTLANIAKKNDEKNSVFERRKEEERKKAEESVVKHVVKHAKDFLCKHVADACKKQDIALVYKSLGGGYTDDLPSLNEAKTLHKE